MKLLLAGCILLFVYAAFVFAKIFLVSRGAALPEVVQEPLLAGRGSVLAYAAAGDSTAAGIGAGSVEASYPRRIAAALAEAREIRYENVAVSGATTETFMSDQLPRLIELQPGLVTISIGANDVTHLVSNETILRNIRFAAERLEKETGAIILIATIPNFEEAGLLPKWYRSILEYKAAEINRGLRSLEGERVRIANIHDYDPLRYPDSKATFARDLFHPNDLGYEAWAAAFLATFEELAGSVR